MCSNLYAIDANVATFAIDIKIDYPNKDKYYGGIFGLGHNATETFAKLQQAYGDNVLSRAQVFRWFKAFSKGRESIEDGSCSRRPSISKTADNVVRVRDLVRSDRRLTVRMIGEEFNLNHTTVHQILTNELKMRKICSKMVPKNLSQVNRFLASKNIHVAPQPPYSPDLSPCDFFLFPKLKNHLKGHHFVTLANIKTAVADLLKAIPISEIHQCHEEWKKRLQWREASEGNYFEEDNVELYVCWNKQVKKVSLII
ncbi:putative mariner transposase [Trichonephila clavipes]|nr:putative mariner transposase [Trichonephila clavipes]